jgi:hypothetical protein
MYKSPILNSLQDLDISLYSFKTVDKKDMLQDGWGTR